MTTPTEAPPLRQRAFRLEYLTIGWNVVEGLVAIGSGIAAGSIALVGFGLDSFIEVFAAVVVLWQLRGVDEEREHRALKLIAVSFFLVAVYVVIESGRDLVIGSKAGESTVGIGIAVLSLLVMPLLARAKRRTAASMGSATLKADAAETLLCTYLSAILLGGLLLNAVLGWWWADSVAALGIAYLAVREGREAWQGDPLLLRQRRAAHGSASAPDRLRPPAASGRASSSGVGREAASGGEPIVAGSRRRDFIETRST